MLLAMHLVKHCNLPWAKLRPNDVDVCPRWNAVWKLLSQLGVGDCPEQHTQLCRPTERPHTWLCHPAHLRPTLERIWVGGALLSLANPGHNRLHRLVRRVDGRYTDSTLTDARVGLLLPPFVDSLGRSSERATILNLVGENLGLDLALWGPELDECLSAVLHGPEPSVRNASLVR